MEPVVKPLEGDILKPRKLTDWRLSASVFKGASKGALGASGLPCGLSKDGAPARGFPRSGPDGGLTRRPPSAWSFSKRVLPAIGLALAVLAISPAARASDANLCDVPGESPDVVVGDIWNVARWGTLNGITAFTFGTDACNLGTCRAIWIASTPAHPLVAENMFRLRDGRFEQLGQSWLKHTFGADQRGTCSSHCVPADGSHLGVNCSDAYDAGTNGAQNLLGPKFEVNPSTGTFPYPSPSIPQTGNAVFKRLQVTNGTLDPALSPGASYFVEIQYITADDAAAGNGNNNASYRPLAVSGSNGTFNVTLIGETHREQAAIHAWKEADPSVVESYGTSDGLYILAAKVTWLGNGLWHYEYAVQNLNANHAATSFSVPIPPATHVTNIGFHDLPYHSGEPQVGDNWLPVVSASPPAVLWQAELSVSPGEIPNALRWGTLYNFRFDADAAPGSRSVTLGLETQGNLADAVLQTQVVIGTVTPSSCDGDGVCAAHETCATCPGDCAGQGGGGGCCGNGTCEAGETPSACWADCGSPAASETRCGDGLDEDRDGLLDCSDPDCCADPACDAFDLDGDSYGRCDCNDANASVWGQPGEIHNVTVTRDPTYGTVLSWGAAEGGSLVYDAIRSASPSNFTTGASCLTALNLPVPAAADTANPLPGGVFHYLVRASNACPSGVGSLGTNSSGVPRAGRLCP